MYRSMRNNSGKPETGRESNRLGVRVPPNEHPDIKPNQNGYVGPGQGGMSVASGITFLQSFHIPRRLMHTCRDEFKRQFRNATGNNSLTIWGLGEGFSGGDVAPGLALRLDPKRPAEHGFVEPGKAMLIEEFESALYRTQDLWIDREPETE